MRANELILLLCMSALAPAHGLWAQAPQTDTAYQAPTDNGDAMPLPGTAPSPALLGSTRDALIRAGDFSGALGPAEAVVAALEDSDPQMPVQLLALALVQSELGTYDTAQENYLHAIDLIEQRDGENSITLASPYQALARSYIKSEKYGEAISVLGQARQITQRNLGLFSLEQVGLLDDMTVAYLGAGDTRGAQQTQEARLEVALRHYGEDKDEVVPFYYHLANYYNRSRMRQHAREQYEAVLAIKRGESAPPVDLLRPLRELVAIDLLTGEDSGARDDLEQLLASGIDPAPRQRAEALVALGDWEMVHNSISLGIGYYRQAHAAYFLDPDAEKSFMSEPALIDFVPPLSPVDRRHSRRPYSWGTIELAFNVSADARVSDVRVVSENPPGVMEEAYVKRLQQTHVRPRLEAGNPVATDDVRFSHYFRYYVEEEKKD